MSGTNTQTLDAKLSKKNGAQEVSQETPTVAARVYAERLALGSVT